MVLRKVSIDDEDYFNKNDLIDILKNVGSESGKHIIDPVIKGVFEILINKLNG